MADITDPTITTYVNEVIRPIADRLIGLSQVIDTELSTWFATISTHPDWTQAVLGTETILDGAANDGRTELTKNDIINFVTQMIALQTQWDGVGVFDVLNKPKVNVILP